jgi:hypothetical protein
MAELLCSNSTVLSFGNLARISSGREVNTSLEVPEVAISTDLMRLRKVLVIGVSKVSASFPTTKP